MTDQRPLYHVRPAENWMNDPGGEVWECPQFFALGDKHVLLVSCMVDGRARPRPIYLVGSFAGGRFTPERMETFDWGPDYYAPTTMRDEQGRRLAWGWSWEARDETTQRAAGGVMSLPRLLTLRPDGLLGLEPVPELTALRARHWSFADVEVAPEAVCILEGVQGDALEIIATFAPDVQVGGVVVRCSPGAEEHTEICYDRPAHGLMLRRGEASADPQAQGGAYGGRPLAAPQPDEPLILRVFVDRSIVEVYVNGRMALTARIYPTCEDSLGVGLIARGGRARATSVDVWTLAHPTETPP